jgi:hypothetical protein
MNTKICWRSISNMKAERAQVSSQPFEVVFAIENIVYYSARHDSPEHPDKKSKGDACISRSCPETFLLIKTILIVISPAFVTYSSKRSVFKTILILIILE